VCARARSSSAGKKTIRRRLKLNVSSPCCDFWVVIKWMSRAKRRNKRDQTTLIYFFVDWEHPEAKLCACVGRQKPRKDSQDGESERVAGVEAQRVRASVQSSSGQLSAAHHITNHNSSLDFSFVSGLSELAANKFESLLGRLSASLNKQASSPRPFII
jgi:hypothetical protein